MPSEASVKFFDETFFQKSFDLALDLSGRQPEKKPATGADAPVRAIATGADGEAGSLPSPSSLTRVHSRLPARSSAERCPLGTSAPQRGRRDLAFCKPLVSCLLGSPFGGAGTAAAVTERASSRDAGAVRRLRGQPTPGARVPVVRTGAAFSRQSRLPARSVLNGLHWGPGPLFP